jgi:N-acetylmuramoyl-L-alanine amidase
LEQKLVLNLKQKAVSFRRVILLILFCSLPSYLLAAETVTVKNIRHWSSPDYTRIVLDLTEPVEFSLNRLSDPERIYFDLNNTTISKDISHDQPIGDGTLKMVRASQFNSTTVRVVFDLENVSDYDHFVLNNPPRIVIDLYGKGMQSQQPEDAVPKRKIIIDPGHGGHDPGAVGPHNLYEKDVVLDIALKLKKILTEDPMNEVYLTRSTDVFLPLEERTAIANKKQADLFVSIHANASLRRSAKGIETYLLNWTDDEEAMKVAARENAISLKTMKAMQRQFDIVKVIKDDLMRQNKRDESVKLAHYIQRSMVSGLEDVYKDITDLGVKQALFYVLFGARMPSVLVEVSFISNPAEEKLLSQDSYRTEVAESICEGIKTYFHTAPAFQKVVEYKGKRI